jgi:hypothetical protein
MLNILNLNVKKNDISLRQNSVERKMKKILMKKVLSSISLSCPDISLQNDEE